jgi:PAS domain S-box-containing protein
MMKDEKKTKKQLIIELVELRKQTEKLKAKVAKSEVIDDRLKESEERYNLLIENANDGINLHGITPEGKPTNFIEVNQRMCEIVGYSKEELLNLSPLDIEEPENSYKEETKALGKKLFHSGHVIFERECLTKDGRKIPLEISSHIFNLKGGRFILSNVRDITERKQKEEDLRKSEEQFKMLFVNAPLAYQSLDEKGNILDVNKKWLNILGYSKEEVIDHHFTEFISPDYINYFRECFPIFKKKDIVEEIKFEMVRKDGKKIIVSFFGNIQRDAKGLFQRTHCIFQDITEQKRIEEQLLQAQKMESVGQLAGGVAHDFNNLLTAIIGYGNLIKTEISQDNLLLSYITQILNSAERAANLTHSLLAFSRRQMVRPKPVNVNSIINSIKNFLPIIIGEDIEFSIFLTDKNLTVMADNNQIEQVLMNLVTNARDAMPDGGRLTIKTDQIELDSDFIMTHGYGKIGAYALISVEDTGQGMDEETKERLFDPFFTTKEVGRGTGLGLSMVYGIIKQHSGYIVLQSEYSKGTTFNIYLPLATPTVEEDKKAKDLPIIKGGNETILIAEDETYVRDFIIEILTGHGYKVIEAIDGDDAIKKLHTHKDKIQLLLLDVIMPKKDGKVVYEEIKKTSPDMKVIFISGYATDILYKRGIIKEELNFVSKPLSLEELLIKVREALDS